MKIPPLNSLVWGSLRLAPLMYLTIAPTANLTCRVQPVGVMFLTFQMLTQSGSKWKITDGYRNGKCTCANVSLMC